MANILRLQNHLKSRPIAPIFEGLKTHEKTNEVALRFMCVIDAEMSKKNLYDRINATDYPKILHELLGFHSYKDFTYYEYRDNIEFDGKLLKCQYGQCQFVGNYMLILTHMAINHKMDIGSQMCLYCDENEELKKHFQEKTFQACYDRYLDHMRRLNDISDDFIEDNAVHAIISDFYEMLKGCAHKLDVVATRRLHEYMGKKFQQSEQLPREGSNEMSRRVSVLRPRRLEKKFSAKKLNELFKTSMATFQREPFLLQPINTQPEPFDDEMNSYGFYNGALVNSSGPRISHVFDFNDRLNTPSRALLSPPAMLGQRNNTPQPGAYDWYIHMIQQRHGNIQSLQKRRAIEDAVKKIYDDAEDEGCY